MQAATIQYNASINGLHNTRVYARASLLSAYTNENLGGHIYTVTITMFVSYRLTRRSSVIYVLLMANAFVNSFCLSL